MYTLTPKFHQCYLSTNVRPEAIVPLGDIANRIRDDIEKKVTIFLTKSNSYKAANPIKTSSPMGVIQEWAKTNCQSWVYDFTLGEIEYVNSTKLDYRDFKKDGTLSKWGVEKNFPIEFINDSKAMSGHSMWFGSKNDAIKFKMTW